MVCREIAGMMPGVRVSVPGNYPLNTRNGQVRWMGFFVKGYFDEGKGPERSLFPDKLMRI